ncbi:hypothetical protein Vretifemale_15186 [Volvox reticuliferus]|uniref:RRM domain-containing protein n=1 Tax=Volvox reticuliferus TaxID=1737510 RepID=A0A8J4CUQ2_9CHLO|nr:hypothetical protein Vretifemale_15186 [Volvox reticuliferus]
MSNTKILENASSLERFLNRHVLFVQGIDQNVSKSEVLQVLNQVLKQPQQGRIDILTTQDGKMRGTAFLNFHNEEDAKAALEMYRFALEIRGRPLRMQFASDREFKEIIQGPLVARFKVLIRNIPEELTPEALHERFSQYGEILQVHTACDHYGQHYAIIQYVETASVQAAIRNANRERVLNHVLMVEPYKPNVTYGMLPRNINQTTSSLLQQAGVPAANGGVAGTSRGGTLPGTTYAALQQQQELEVAEQERYFAEGNSDSGGGRRTHGVRDKQRRRVAGVLCQCTGAAVGGEFGRIELFRSNDWPCECSHGPRQPDPSAYHSFASCASAGGASVLPHHTRAAGGPRGGSRW